MAPFQVKFIQEENTVRANVSIFKLQDFFSNFLLGIKEQSPIELEKRIRFWALQNVKLGYMTESIFITSELNNFIVEILRDQIKLDSTELGVIICYFFGYKKMLINYRERLQSKLNKYTEMKSTHLHFKKINENIFKPLQINGSVVN